MATTIYRHQTHKNMHMFRTTENYTLCVTAFNDGIATVEPLIDDTIEMFAKNIAGCFRVKSNFKKELLKAFGYNCSNREESAIFKGIFFEFNGAEVLVTKENANEDAIYAKWRDALEKVDKKDEEIVKSADSLGEKVKGLKCQLRREAVDKDIIAIDESTEMEFKDEKAAEKWAHWAEVSSRDFYSNGIFTYARQWAKYMQYVMQKHNKTVAEVAKQTRDVCNLEGITCFMYGAALGILSNFWKYGDDLRRWHNKSYGYEGNSGVVNPAVITVIAS